MGGKPPPRYGTIKKLREQAALFSLLTSNGITTMQQLYEKVDSMNSSYYDLRGKIVSAERRIAVLEERLSMFQQYKKYKAIHRQYAKMKPAKQEQFEQRYHAELALYDAAVRYLENLKPRAKPSRRKSGEARRMFWPHRRICSIRSYAPCGRRSRPWRSCEKQRSSLKRTPSQRRRSEMTPNAEQRKAAVQNHASIRRQALFPEQVAVRPGAGQGQHQHLILDAVRSAANPGGRDTHRCPTQLPVSA